jgi:glycosyltransferase involved in cell wall biosynthesis
VDPRASVLIPVFNREKLIGPCIESALKQTVEDIEVVVCDNCSTDGTWDGLQEYAKRDRRVRIFRNTQNLGPVRNWARCVAEARAPYAKLLFSDDLMGPSYLERALPLIGLPDVGLVFSGCEVGEEPGKSSARYSFARADGVWEPGRFLLGHVFAYDVPVSPGAALLHTVDVRDCLATNPPTAVAQEFFRTGAGPDLLLLLEAEHQHGRIAHIPEKLMFFRAHPDSITVRENDKVSSLYRHAIAWFLARNRPALLRSYLSGIRWQMGKGSGMAEIAKIIDDLGLAGVSAPHGMGYMMDMMGRLRRSVHRKDPVQPYE